MINLSQTILAHGAESVTFTIPLRPMRQCVFVTFSNDEEEPTECYIDQSRYKLENNYKIELVPFDYPVHPKRSFYLSDLAALMNSSPEDFKMHLMDTV